ncbi:hypothetical protein [Sodalis sp. RH16]|uniref:hypothetical protein n=1 Tax=unclassified Sodalis (in: enterobacteria) TaxID=2636512 RepID=UPI0039B682A2
MREVLNWAGNGAALIGILFVYLRLKDYMGSHVLSNITSEVWVYCAILAGVYGIANVLLALAWRQLLLQAEIKTTYKWSIRTYGISQLAKYVPGNIFHIAGRQSKGMAAGISARVLARSSLLELGSIAFAGLLFSWLVVPLFVKSVPIVVCAALLTFSFWIITALLKRTNGKHLSTCFRLHMVFLLISGAIFSILLDLIIKGENFYPQTWLLIMSSYVIAWLAGLITPGAPAGVGVREWILLFLLKGYITETDLIMVILLGRAVTVVGDLLFFCVSFLIPISRGQHKNEYN